MQTNTHLARLVHDQAKIYGDREVLIYKDFGGKEWKSLSWNQFSDTVRVVSNALLNLGVKVQENVGVFSQNSIQYLGYPCRHHPLLCYQQRTADSVHGERRKGAFPFRRRTRSV